MNFNNSPEEVQGSDVKSDNEKVPQNLLNEDEKEIKYNVENRDVAYSPEELAEIRKILTLDISDCSQEKIKELLFSKFAHYLLMDVSSQDIDKFTPFLSKDFLSSEKCQKELRKHIINNLNGEWSTKNLLPYLNEPIETYIATEEGQNDIRNKIKELIFSRKGYEVDRFISHLTQSKEDFLNSENFQNALRDQIMRSASMGYPVSHLMYYVGKDFDTTSEEIQVALKKEIVISDSFNFPTLILPLLTKESLDLEDVQKVIASMFFLTINGGTLGQGGAKVFLPYLNQKSLEGEEMQTLIRSKIREIGYMFMNENQQKKLDFYLSILTPESINSKEVQRDLIGMFLRNHEKKEINQLIFKYLSQESISSKEIQNVLRVNPND